ncbi:MAG: segregation/condensation protein A [Kiritimatiellae bacterium]|nr:segregation/condensation protein A [Kiritimatiellia bacterium]
MLQLQQDDYKVNLEVFEGPLDLLLYLIRKDELDIYDIPIARIADEYAEYLRLMEMLDLNLAGEFVVMAATLSYIKSRMLLPPESRPEDAPDEADEGKDPRWDLVRQLLDYKRFKDAAGGLLELERRRQNMFAPSGAPLLPESAKALPDAKPLGDIGIFDLVRAFRDVLERAPVEPIGEIEPAKWRVSDKIDEILRLATTRRAVAFSSLFSPESPRGEIIVTVLALLELLRLRQVVAAQDAAFGEISIRPFPEDPSGADAADARPVIGGSDHVE